MARERLCSRDQGDASTVRVLLGFLFLRLAEGRYMEPAGQLRRLLEEPDLLGNAFALSARAARRYRSSLLLPPERDGPSEECLRDFLAGIHADGPYAAAELGRAYERMLEPTASRKAAGIYYTPDSIVAAVVDATLGRFLAEQSPARVDVLRILDPACGSGAFLLAVYDCLLDWYRKHTSLSPDAVRRKILLGHLHGVDRDPIAVEVARLSLILKAAEEEGTFIPDLAGNIQCGDALLGPDFFFGERGALAPCLNKQGANAPRSSGGFDWDTAFPTVMSQSFSVVIGNPPWGQKNIDVSAEMKRYLTQRFPSSAGIHDLFRPFVELGVRLTAAGGRFGMVLPDIILLKDYPQTRRYLLDQLTLERIDWWGRAFTSATIDTVTIVGRKEPAPPRHGVAVQIHDQSPLSHIIPQADFLANPRHIFNLYLTPARRRVVNRLASCPRLGDYFEIHEGVHSGNIRGELFVSEAVDASCRPLLFGRDEITPYRLHWQGRYIRFAAMPARKTRERYANLGRPEWHERPKLLVRRTGDFLLAAVDDEGRYASNNFFLVFPRRPCSLDLDGLCALLNSGLMTWYFRALEPRQGRAFAELKIKHLRAFPLPDQVREADGCGRLNELGAQQRVDETLDEAIAVLLKQMFGITEAEELTS